MQLVILIAH